MKLISVGDLMFEVVVHPDELAQPGDEALAQFTIRPGGQALNVARVFNRLGGEATLVAALGNDEWGAWLEKSLVTDGIRLFKQSSKQATGMVVSISADQDRTMYAYRGANAELDIASINLDAWSKAETMLYLSGYLLSTSQGQAQVQVLLNQPHTGRFQFVLDTPPRHVLQQIGRDVFLRAIQGVHKLFTTLDEGRFLTQETDLESVALKLQKACGLVVVKLGGEGCWVQSQGQGKRISTTPLKRIDATGAGDAFCGAFLKGLAQGMSEFESAELANQTAGKLIDRTRVGELQD